MSITSQDGAPIYSVIGQDPDLGELVDGFVAGIPNHVATLTQALAANDRELLRRTAHQLKGSAGSYGFHEVTSYAASVELQSDDATSLEELEASLAALLDVCRRLRAGGPK